jgi:methionyl aminopeptidase
MVVTAVNDIRGAAAAAERVVELHHRLVEFLRADLTLTDIDEHIATMLKAHQCRSAFHRYRIPAHPPFPSFSCLSVNDCIVHGTHNMREAPLRSGDLLSVDIGVIYKGWVGDAAWTYAIEDADERRLDLMRCGQEALRRGLASIRAGRPLMDWARAVQHHVEDECGYHLVRGLGGHGYGRELHGPPFVSNVLPRYNGEWPDQWKLFEPGMLVAVEPMIAIGTSEVRTHPRSWPIFTADGSLSVHYEADVLVTPEGPMNLTEGLWDLPEVVG